MSFMSVLPNSNYMTLFSFAMGVSSLIQNALRAFTLLWFDNSETIKSTIVFYSISFLLLLFAASMHFVETKSQMA